MVGGKPPLLLYAPDMKINSCCVSPLACFKYLYNPLKCWVKTDKFADPSQEMKWAVFSLVLSQSSYKIIVVEELQGKNLIFDILYF